MPFLSHPSHSLKITFLALKLITFLSFSIFSLELSAKAPDSDCILWFNSSKVKSNTKTCEIECSTILTDMETFACPQQCDLLCQTKKSPYSQFIYYPGLTPEEKLLAEKYPKDAITVFLQKTKAEWSTSRNFPNQKLNDESDAFRHFIWAGLLTKELGLEKAKQFLNAHEESRLQSESEKQMDLYNNQKGQQAAATILNSKNWSLNKLETEALKALKNKQLKVLKPNQQILEKPQ